MLPQSWGRKTNRHLSDLQRILLLNTLQGVKQSYEDIAEPYNYSPRYLRQNIAPKLWQLLSQALAYEVSKSNVRSVLECQMSVPLTHLVQTHSSKAPSTLEDLLPPSIVELHSAALAKGNILIVDDCLENLALLSYFLEKEGHRVRQAINGKMALEIISFISPDLLLLDVNIPGVDSHSVFQKLKDNPMTKDTPVIFMGAIDEVWDKVGAFSVGDTDCITKPFNSVEVVARVQKQLKIRQLQQTLREQKDQLQRALIEIATLRDQL